MCVCVALTATSSINFHSTKYTKIKSHLLLTQSLEKYTDTKCVFTDTNRPLSKTGHPSSNVTFPTLCMRFCLQNGWVLVLLFLFAVLLLFYSIFTCINGPLDTTFLRDRWAVSCMHETDEKYLFVCFATWSSKTITAVLFFLLSMLCVAIVISLSSRLYETLFPTCISPVNYWLCFLSVYFCVQCSLFKPLDFYLCWLMKRVDLHPGTSWSRLF